MKAFYDFWKDDRGQDTVEYILLVAFVAIASAAIFLAGGGSIQGIWSTSNSQITAANASAS
jgi:Flp pilus assembly pilin Flp